MLSRFLPILIMSLITVTGYAAPQFGDIARNANGSVRYMNVGDAIDYCASQEMHLPSARELAQLSVSMGSEISETRKDGYNLVSARNVDGKEDNFYMNVDAYKRPAGDLGNNSFISSSNFIDNTDSYIFDGLDGRVNAGLYSGGAVLCVIGH
jgi:hypothetical protein